MSKCEIKKAGAGRFMFNLKAGNGEVILASQMYESKAGALSGIESVKSNAKADAQFERKESGKGEPFFVLKATNGQVIGQSEMYSSTSSVEGGIASVRKNAPVVTVSDLAR